MELGDVHKGSKDFTIGHNDYAQINGLEISTETRSRVGGGGRIVFSKPLAHSQCRNRINIIQIMSLHSIKPSSVFPLHFK